MKILKYLSAAAIIFLVVTPFSTGCKSGDGENPAPERFIKDVILSPIYRIQAGRQITFAGKGFIDGDRLSLAGTEGGRISLASVFGERSATFTVPGDIKTGDYSLFITRGQAEQLLGKFTLRVTPIFNIEDKPGATIKGAVYCGGEAVPGVAVSDGVEVTVTDENGYYWLNSAKKHGYVFISIPSGYEAISYGSLPDFWAGLREAGGVVEQHDFELTKADNDDFVMIVSTDTHLANRTSTNDMTQYEGLYVPDVRNLLSTKYPAGKVYNLILGDMTWDAYWYTNGFGPAEYKDRIKDFPVTIFHTMGNHDNDPSRSGDFECEAKYKKELGPTYYSFNLGKVHYVVLDNIIYKNDTGLHDFDAAITQEQIDWLKKDLALVADKTAPLMVALHVPAYRLSGNDGGSLTVVSNMQASSVSALKSCFTDFDDVHYLSGHTHRNYHLQAEPNIMEHNIAAICATWWWTGFLGFNHICTDGSYGGYAVHEFKGADLKWYYKSIGFAADAKQFRTYDMNMVKSYFSNPGSADVIKYFSKYPARENYSAVGNNNVLINVWGYDNAWTIKATENGIEREVKHIRMEDPLHTISYDIPRAQTADLTDSFVTNNTVHMFMVEALLPDSSIDIEVTDRFGNVYRELMQRPKAFNWTTK